MQRLLLFACMFFNFAASSQQFPFVYYTPKDGLINSRVRSIKQDSKGRMYFITYGGLSVYDGARFTNYDRQNGLANELINDVVELGPDSMLVATNTMGLNTLIKGKVGLFKTSDGFSPLVNRFLKTADGNWYVTGDAGLFRMNGNKFEHIPLVDSSGQDIGYNLDRITEWKNFFLIIPWTNDKRKMIVYDRLSGRTGMLTQSEKLTNVSTDHKGQLWITGSGPVKNIDTLSLLKGQVRLINPPAQYSTVTERSHGYVFTDASNNLWFYGADTIRKIAPDFKVQKISAANGLKVSNLSDVFQDREGIIWMASDGNGVIKMSGINIQLLDAFPGKKPSSISSVAQEKDTIWLFDSNNNSIHRVFKDGIKTFFLSNENPRPGILIPWNNRLYLIGETTVGIIKNRNEQRSYRSPVYLTHKGGDQALSFGDALIDPHGHLIQHFKQGELYFIKVMQENTELMRTEINYSADHIAIDKTNRLWVPTRNDHLLVFSLHPENPSNYLKLEKDFAEVLPKDLSPRSIIVDQENNIWIGTRYKGVFKFTIPNNSIKSYKQFTTHEGLSDNFIYNLRCDQKNTIWLGTQSGLDKIFLKEGKYITGNVSKGHNFFQSVMMLETTIHNTTWALTSGGTIIKVDTTSISKMLGPPPLLLSAMFINNEEYNGSSNRFSYKKNNLLFQVSSASFVDEHAIRYSYLLEGSGNDSWSKPSSNATLNFNNLSPGNYTLHVRSDFPEAIYRSQTLSYSFTILPPWWSSWWFLSLVGILMLFSLTMILRNYYRRKLEKKTIVLERQQAIEKERTRIATDMHDDLGAGLSTIRFLSEKVKRNSFSDVTKSDAEKIVFNSNELVQKMNEIIWAMNEKNDTLEDLLFYTRSYAVEYCEENEIACEISLPENIPSQFVSGEIRRNVFLTVKESLHNIVKHSGAKNVKIVFEIDRHLCASISDDGQGMAIKEGMGGNGLRNMRKRVESVNGKFEIRNNKGVTIQIEIPLTV